MPKFPPECLQKLRDAGLTVSCAAYDELEDHEVETYRGRLTVQHEQYHVWMFSHEGKWMVESHVMVPGPGPGDFLTEWQTPYEAVDDAIKFFAGDERWQLKEKIFKYTQHKIPGYQMQKVDQADLIWERLDGKQGYEIRKPDTPGHVRVSMRDQKWFTQFWYSPDDCPKNEWESSEKAIDDAIDFYLNRQGNSK